MKTTKIVNGVETDDTENYKKSNTPDPIVTTKPPKTTRPTKTAPSWSPIAMQEVGMVSTSRSVNDVNADLSKAQRAYNKAGDEIGRAAAMSMIQKFQKELTGIKNEGDVTKGGLSEAYNYDFGDVLKEFDVNTKGLDEATKKTKQLETAAMNAANAASAIGQAFNSIEDPASKVAGTIAQAIATMALSYAQASAATSHQGWAWLAFAATGLATMITSINAIKQNAGSFEEGGIVGGNSYHGDRLTANVNSGELIMSVAQQNNVASKLMERNNQSGYGGTPYVDGEKIWLGLGNYLKRSGRGEIITSKNR